jgi:hypothetical protein
MFVETMEKEPRHDDPSGIMPDARPFLPQQKKRSGRKLYAAKQWKGYVCYTILKIYLSPVNFCSLFPRSRPLCRHVDIGNL